MEERWSELASFASRQRKRRGKEGQLPELVRGRLRGNGEDGMEGSWWVWSEGKAA